MGSQKQDVLGKDSMARIDGRSLVWLCSRRRRQRVVDCKRGLGLFPVRRETVGRLHGWKGIRMRDSQRLFVWEGGAEEERGLLRMQLGVELKRPLGSAGGPLS